MEGMTRYEGGDGEGGRCGGRAAGSFQAGQIWHVSLNLPNIAISSNVATSRLGLGIQCQGSGQIWSNLLSFLLFSRCFQGPGQAWASRAGLARFGPICLIAFMFIILLQVVFPGAGQA